MQDTWTENLNGFKVFVNDLKSNKNVDYLFSLTVFDTQVDTPLVAVPIAQVSPGILSKYPPRGGTALYDAIGSAAQATQPILSDVDKVICVIVTDGQENSSCEYKKDSIHALIDSKLKEGNWTFQYLGTQPETWDDSSKIGLAAGSTVQYSGVHTQSMYAAVSDSVNCFSSSVLRSSDNLIGSFASTAKIKAACLKLDKDQVQR